MKKIELEIPEGKEAKWVDGVLTLVDEKPIEYKFKVGDKVYYDGRQYKIKERLVHCGEPSYKFDGHPFVIQEWRIEISSQYITERIEMFDDAVEWCERNDKENLVLAYNEIYGAFGDMADMQDVFAYLKLRIITAALNEGWEPTFEEDEERWRVVYEAMDDSYDSGCSLKWETTPNKLILKSERLAEYAAHQFRNIYADFCGYKKDKNEGDEK